MEQFPLVSVVMPVHNAERFVGEAIASILGQTLERLELVVVDDGSTDRSGAIIGSFHDPRLRVITQPNAGIAAALNAGIAASRGALIARMDADDVALPERLAKQVAFMEAHPEVGLLGTWAVIEDEQGRVVGAHEHPADDALIRWSLLFDTPFVHPTMVIRRALFEQVGGYDGDPGLFEDFNLWSRMIRHTCGANLPEHLLRYRLVGTSLSHVTTRRLERVHRQRLLNVQVEFAGLDRATQAGIAELGLRHAAITVPCLLRVRRLLRARASRLIHEPAARRKTLREVDHALIGYRLIRHRTFAHRLTDRILKESLVLALRLGLLR